MKSVWMVTEYARINDGPAEIMDTGQLYATPSDAMKDILYAGLNWKKIDITKFDGTMLTHYQADSGRFHYIIEEKTIIGDHLCSCGE